MLPLTPGSTFERYEIQSLIGRGGMGEVYRAIDTRLHRQVALKVLRTDAGASATARGPRDSGGVARLLREARAAAALNHANSVAIYELGEAEGIAYIAMELVTGVTLRKYLGVKNVSVETKVSWLVDAARALWAAHKAGLVHRDVKPGNIMVSEEGVVKVLDFGLAKPVTAAAITNSPSDFQTMAGQVLGTPRYMAPEQLEGATPDALADQFAFGLTAYELLSGVYPGGPLAGAPTSLHGLVPGVSEQLAREVARMMSRRPADRFPTMEAAAHALRIWAPIVRTMAPVAAFHVARESEAPTAAVSLEAATRMLDQDAGREPVSREIPINIDMIMAKGATLPLAQPLKMAMGQSAAASTPFGRTMPLASPLAAGLSLPQTPSGGLTPKPSGVYTTWAAEEAALQSQSLAVTGRRAAGTSTRPDPSPTPSWVPLLIVGLVAAAAGGLAAWLFH